MTGRTLSRGAALVTLALLAACDDRTPPVAPPTALGALTAARPTADQLPPTGKNVGTLTARVDRTRYPIQYHGGPVMPSWSDVYIIWYGDWSSTAARNAQMILADFATHVGGTSYWRINRLYAGADGNAPTGDMVFGGTGYDAYSHGTALSDADLPAIVEAQIAAGQLPADARGLYVVATSADVDETSGFGSSYCGFHQQAIIAGLQLKYIFVGNPERFAAQCIPQAVSPNGDAAADAMASVLANEMANAITDPALTAWYDRLGLEQADKCAWTYGKRYRAANGAWANVHVGARDYLVQQLWVPSARGGSCALAAP